MMKKAPRMRCAGLFTFDDWSRLMTGHFTTALCAADRNAL